MTPIFITDLIWPKPGKTRAVLDAYMEGYVPAACERGMTLRDKLITPPVILQGGQGNMLSFTWQVDGVGGWWAQRLAASANPAISAFWTELSPLIVKRDRRVSEEVSQHV